MYKKNMLVLGAIVCALGSPLFAADKADTKTQDVKKVDPRFGVSPQPTKGLTRGPNRPEFTIFHHPVAVFKTFGKHPFLTTLRPAQNEFQTLFFATEMPCRGRRLMKDRTQDLKTLVTVRDRRLMLDGNVKLDSTFRGFQESVGANLLETGLQLTGLLGSDDYKGMPFIDQMKENIPMMWVFKNVGEFKALKEYITKQIIDKTITFTKKPLLLLEIIDTTKELDQSDYNFINTYFRQVDPTDPETQQFFANIAKTFYEITTNGIGYKTVGESMGERIMGITNDYHGFKVKYLLADAIKFGIAGLTMVVLYGLLKDEVFTPAQKKVKKGAKFVVDETKNQVKKGADKIKDWAGAAKAKVFG